MVLPYQLHLLPSLVVLPFLFIHLHLNMTFDGLLLLLSSVLSTRTISHILIFAFEFIISMYTSPFFSLNKHYIYIGILGNMNVLLGSKVKRCIFLSYIK